VVRSTVREFVAMDSWILEASLVETPQMTAASWSSVTVPSARDRGSS
jgi:hypothetical protein